ncbi:hypothetical protein A2311_05880 [candidate division WOR-1 bacterium RIFOXYB2_FULL_48_7]|uniref:DUF2914 domain-containing protein n=1 Tax=candidate division WOR-1 bacterium RIFOXYB2_FULL_48_7 TaxID=1802583 RepID=A0A1F4T9P3_UNCSA|nr:MAG: hypothetical protein A2311_05880 [candidate division WOR-1 bacterium RIFOXYB2_FULL_48_7]
MPPTISVGINQVVISSGIEQHRPIDDLGQVELAQGMIYCYSRVALTVVPQTISHCWYGPKGNLIAEIKLTIARNPADTWSYVGLANGGRGNWTVIIKAADGTELAKKQFQVI